MRALSESAIMLLYTTLYNLEEQHKDDYVSYAVEAHTIMEFIMSVAKAHGATTDDICQAMGLEGEEEMKAYKERFIEEAPAEALEEAMEILDRLRKAER